MSAVERNITWLLWGWRGISLWAFNEPMCIYLCSTLLGLPVGQLGWTILAMTLRISMVGLITTDFHWARPIYQAFVITNTVLATIFWIRWSFFASVLAVLACWSMAKSFASRNIISHLRSTANSSSLSYFTGCLEIDAEQCRHLVNHVVHKEGGVAFKGQDRKELSLGPDKLGAQSISVTLGKLGLLPEHHVSISKMRMLNF